MSHSGASTPVFAGLFLPLCGQGRGGRNTGVLASLPEPPALCPLRWLFFTPIGDCFVTWPAEHGILDLATDQLCGPGQVTVALSLSCPDCEMGNHATFVGWEESRTCESRTSVLWPPWPGRQGLQAKEGEEGQPPHGSERPQRAQELSIIIVVAIYAQMDTKILCIT